MATRPPAVAGSFDPARPEALASMVDELLADARPKMPGGPTKALVSPHAGFIYSGSTAALGFATLNPATHPISRVVIAGPTHRVGIEGVALPGTDAFATPLGEVPVDTDTVARLVRLRQVRSRPDVHADEHALEVQLPFLQRILDGFVLVPLAVGEIGAEAVAEVLDAVWGGPETLVIISTDLSHYHPYRQARELDRATIDAILACQVPISDRLACGVRPLNGFLTVAARRGLRPALLGMCNSGDTAGDRSRVVGYASVAWHEEVE